MNNTATSKPLSNQSIPVKKQESSLKTYELLMLLVAVFTALVLQQYVQAQPQVLPYQDDYQATLSHPPQPGPSEE